MGADLIVHLSFVPMKITKAMTTRATKRVKRILDAVKKCRNRFDGETDVLWADIPAILQDICSMHENYYGTYDQASDFWEVLDRTEKDLKNLDIEEIAGFLDHPNTRDAAWRSLPFEELKKYKVVATGDTTWGDAPDGEGFSIFNLLEIYELTKCFGVV